MAELPLPGQVDWSDSKWLVIQDGLVPATSALTRGRVDRLLKGLPALLGHPVEVIKISSNPNYASHAMFNGTNGDRLYLVFSGPYMGHDAYKYAMKLDTNDETLLEVYEGRLLFDRHVNAVIRRTTQNSPDCRACGDYTIAQVGNNFIVINFDLFRDRADSDDMKRALKYILDWAIPQLKLEPWDPSDKADRVIKKTLLDTLTAMTKAHVDSLAAAKQETSNAAQQLVYCIKHQAIQQSVVNASSSPETLAAQVEYQRKLMRGLLDSGQYTGFTLANGLLTGSTSGVKVEGRDFGLWAIDLNLSHLTRGSIEHSSILCRWISGGEKSRDNFRHPHVSVYNEPCLGDLYPDLCKAFAMGQVMEIFASMRAFMDSYNSKAPFVKLSFFQPIAQAAQPVASPATSQDVAVPESEEPNEDDEDSDPCESCDERGTPFCINDCGDSWGGGCGDCEHHEDDDRVYCVEECHYNRRQELFNPCTLCDNRDGSDCSDPECPHCVHEFYMSI